MQTMNTRAAFYYPKCVEDNKVRYTDNEAAMMKRDAYIKGAEEQRKIDADNVTRLARIIYDFFALEKREINREKFIEAFTNTIYEE